MTEKIPYHLMIGKMIVTKEGKRLGFVKDITFETKSGELISLIVREATLYKKNHNLAKSSEGDYLIPYAAIIAISDFIIVSEEDLI
jgi:sporulation protein YlmC with PRC-barrel domain